MRLFEIINTPISSDLSYDLKHNRLKIRKKPSLVVDRENGRVLSVPNKPPKLTLKHLHRIRLLRRKYVEQKRKLTQLRGLMYGGTARAQQQELEATQAQITDLQSQLAAEVQAAELEQGRKDELNAMTMRYVKRSIASR